MSADTSLDALADLSDKEDAEELDLSPFQIDWLDVQFAECEGKLGICSLPGCRYKKTWRSISHDIDCLVQAGVKAVFCLCTQGDFYRFRTQNLLEKYSESGLNSYHYPIEDGQVYPMEDLLTMIEEIRVSIASGKKTVIHCYGGLGRSCTVAACFLMVMNNDLDSEQASKKLKDLKGNGAIYTVKQHNFVSEFRDLLKAYREKKVETDSRSVSR